MAEKGTLALNILVIYNQTMRLFFTLVMFCLMCLCAPFAVAEERKALPKPECTLKNKVFCGEWETNQTYHLNITGSKIIYIDAKPSDYTCKIIDEFSDKLHPYSILQCTYYDEDWSKREITEFHMFYLSDYNIKRSLESPSLQVVSHATKSKIQDLFIGYCNSSVTKDDSKCEKNDIYPNIGYDNERLSRYRKTID